MFLDVSAMYLLERHRAREADRRRGLRDAILRDESFEARGWEAVSGDVAGVALGDRSRRVGDASSDLGRCHDLDPAAGTQ
jgi:hypothetical protein